MDIIDHDNLCNFLYPFISSLNESKAIDTKMKKALIEVCNYLGCKRGFVYHTDGFRFFHLKETFGNEDHTLHNKFEPQDMTPMHIEKMKDNILFCASKNENPSPEDSEILDFYNVESLFIDSIKDTEKKVIGFIGFADWDADKSFSENDKETLQFILNLLSREVTIREYQERGVRIKNTLESIMNNMGVDIYVNSFDSHDMLYANETMAAPYGGVKHFDGKKCWQALYNDKNGECDYCPREKLLDEKGLPTRSYSWDYQRPFDKSWFRVFSTAFNWVDGQMAHIVTSVDITNQKKIEEQLRQEKDKAENLDRLKSAFLANMSHEIRTPLNAIVGFSDLLAETDDPAERSEYIHIVQENNRLLLQLISDILDLSKIESGILEFGKESINIRELCMEIIRSYQIKQNGGVLILLAENLKDYVIHSDKKRLMQVITNFINNAMKFTHQGRIILGYEFIEDKIKFYVRDTGIGIPSDKQEQVFDRFMKVDTFSQGTGLGLSICKSIVEQLKGTIGVESEQGVGSCFWFMINR